MLHTNNKYDYRGSKQKRGSLSEFRLPLVVLFAMVCYFTILRVF